MNIQQKLKSISDKLEPVNDGIARLVYADMFTHTVTPEESFPWLCEGQWKLQDVVNDLYFDLAGTTDARGDLGIIAETRPVEHASVNLPVLRVLEPFERAKRLAAKLDISLTEVDKLLGLNVDAGMQRMTMEYGIPVTERTPLFQEHQHPAVVGKTWCQQLGKGLKLLPNHLASGFPVYVQSTGNNILPLRYPEITDKRKQVENVTHVIYPQSQLCWVATKGEHNKLHMVVYLIDLNIHHDVGLQVARYAFLHHLICAQTGLERGDLTFSISGLYASVQRLRTEKKRFSHRAMTSLGNPFRIAVPDGLPHDLTEAKLHVPEVAAIGNVYELVRIDGKGSFEVEEGTS